MRPPFFFLLLLYFSQRLQIVSLYFSFFFMVDDDEDEDDNVRSREADVCALHSNSGSCRRHTEPPCELRPTTTTTVSCLPPFPLLISLVALIYLAAFENGRCHLIGIGIRIIDPQDGFWWSVCFFFLAGVGLGG